MVLWRQGDFWYLLYSPILVFLISVSVNAIGNNIQGELWQYEMSTNLWHLLSRSTVYVALLPLIYFLHLSYSSGNFPPEVGTGGLASYFFPPPRAQSSAVCINGSFYIWGGYNLDSSGAFFFTLFKHLLTCSYRQLQCM